jgi:hypothetical protein
MIDYSVPPGLNPNVIRLGKHILEIDSSPADRAVNDPATKMSRICAQPSGLSFAKYWVNKFRTKPFHLVAVGFSLRMAIKTPIQIYLFPI